MGSSKVKPSCPSSARSERGHVGGLREVVLDAIGDAVEPRPRRSWRDLVGLPGAPHVDGQLAVADLGLAIEAVQLVLFALAERDETPRRRLLFFFTIPSASSSCSLGPRPALRSITAR